MNGLLWIFDVTDKVSEAATGGVLYKKSVLKNFNKFTGKHLCQSVFLNKFAGLGLQLY